MTTNDEAARTRRPSEGSVSPRPGRVPSAQSSGKGALGTHDKSELFPSGNRAQFYGAPFWQPGQDGCGIGALSGFLQPEKRPMNGDTQIYVSGRPLARPWFSPPVPILPLASRKRAPQLAFPGTNLESLQGIQDALFASMARRGDE